MRRLIAGLIVVGLAIGVWVLWPRDDQSTPDTTTPLAIVTTTGAPSTNTTVPLPTSTTLVTQNRDVETVEQAEAILRELWFGWFEGIYNQDEERIKEVVASQQFLDDARQAFGEMKLVSKPRIDSLIFVEVEILRSTDTCLVVWSDSDLSELLGNGSTRLGVDVLRWVDSRWRMFSAWTYKGDIWETDCDSQLEPLS